MVLTEDIKPASRTNLEAPHGVNANHNTAWIHMIGIGDTLLGFDEPRGDLGDLPVGSVRGRFEPSTSHSKRTRYNNPPSSYGSLCFGCLFGMHLRLELNHARKRESAGQGPLQLCFSQELPSL